LAHTIEDLAQFYDKNPPNEGDPETYTERVQYMFRSDPIPSTGAKNQFANGGGPAYFDNVFQGTGDAARNAKAIGTYQGERRMGHLCALQRSSRAPDGTPLHIRNDGPGFDNMDVPGGSKQPKLAVCRLRPHRRLLPGDAGQPGVAGPGEQVGVDPSDNGLERFLTATRRQNFLVPPRRHRAFPFA
jgi:hypothetical protein